MFLYYVNDESDDIIGGFSTVQHAIKNISRNIGAAVFFKLGTTNVPQKRNRMTPTMLLPWQQKYWSSVLQTWYHKCTSKKKQNDTYYVVAMATEILEQCSSNLVPEMYIKKETE